MVVSVCNKEFFKKIVGNDNPLWEIINTAANFEVDPSIMHGFERVVIVDEFFTDVAEFDADIVGAIQWIFGIEVHDFLCGKLGSPVREDIVEDKFDKIKICSPGSHVA